MDQSCKTTTDEDVQVIINIDNYTNIKTNVNPANNLFRPIRLSLHALTQLYV